MTFSYAVLAMATDYDCWREDHDHVTVDAVIAVLNRNSSVAQNLVRSCIAKICAHTGGDPPTWSALANGIMTAPTKIPRAKLLALQPLIGKYLPYKERTSLALPLFLALSGLVYAWAESVHLHS